MSSALRAAAALFLLLSADAASAQRGSIAPRHMLRHIEVLASDAYEGRKPGTRGEERTIAYIAAQLRARRVEPGAADGSWYQPLVVAERRAGSHSVRWTAGGGRPVPFEGERIVLFGKEASERIADAPVLFVGHGLVAPDRGVDQLAGADLGGAVALMLVEPPQVPDFPSYDERVQAIAARGAAAVIGIVGDEVPWSELRRAAGNPQTELDIRPAPRIRGAIQASEAARLAAAAGADFRSLLDEQPGPSFRAVPLSLRASFAVTTEVRRYTTHNVVGRIRGTGGGRESVLLLGHWDHLGLCRPEGEADRICNGAVDNASGIAMLIEVAGRLARGRRPQRDVILLATSVEEVGLLGAEHFAQRPTVPLGSIVAAVNIDTVAIHGRGEPVAVIGRGIAPLDAAIEATVAAMGRTMDRTHAADAFVTRQDGWALSRAGVPAVMVGGSFANMEALEAFLSTTYHGPDDEAGRHIPLEGAAQDANLLVALARRLASPALYQPPRR